MTVLVNMWRGSISENPAVGLAAMEIHILDVMLNLLGPLHSATTLSGRRVLQAPIDDTTAALLSFESGVSAGPTTLIATASYSRLHLFGSAGWALIPY